MTTPLLAMTGISHHFGGVTALRGATLTIGGTGVVHGLIGETGSGKSTLLNILCGNIRPDAGTIAFAGRETWFSDPREALKAGISLVSQEIAVAPDLTVGENILLGRRMSRGITGIRWAETRRRASAALARLGLDYDPDTKVGTLRPDQQQMVEIARAISMDSRLVVLDEPTSSLSDDEVRQLFTAIRQMTRSGVSVLFVSHRLPELFEICDEVTVLRDGITVESGPITEWTPDELVDAMVGAEGTRTLPVARPRDDGGDALPALEVHALRAHGSTHATSLSVRRGEIVGLAGLVGSGRQEILASLFGDVPAHSGSVKVGGNELKLGSTRRSISAGLGYVPPERKTQGVVLNMSVRANLSMVATARKARLSSPPPRLEREFARRASSVVKPKASSLEAPVGSLSGGNQQKVALGKWLTDRPAVLLLDEPTRGVDVGAKREIHQQLREVAADGTAILMSSSENPELLELCDRILIMNRGQIVAEFQADELDEPTLVRIAGGHS